MIIPMILIIWWRLWCPPLTAHNWLIRLAPKDGESIDGRSSTFGRNHDCQLFKMHPHTHSIWPQHCQDVINQPLLTRYIDVNYGGQKVCGIMLFLILIISMQHVCNVLMLSMQHMCGFLKGLLCRKRLLPWLWLWISRRPEGCSAKRLPGISGPISRVKDLINFFAHN